MWLEIDNKNIIIGVHNTETQSPNTLVEHDGDATPGDVWQNDTVIPRGDVTHNNDGIWQLKTSAEKLIESQLLATSDIDDAAGNARARYITISPGQEATYIIKERQALDYAADNYLTTNVPAMILADATSYGVSNQAAADNIIAMAAQWVALATAIEQIRMTAKNAVSTATDDVTIASILGDAISQLDAI